MSIPGTPMAIRRHRSGVYLLLLAGTVVYVGASRNVDYRLQVHASVLECDAASVLAMDQPFIWRVERALIYAYAPEHNTTVHDIGERERAILAELGVEVLDEERSLAAVAATKRMYDESWARRRRSP